jgi:peptide/nickel transport system permease protein
VTRLIVRRLGLMMITMVIVSIFVFTITEILPVSVARMILGQFASEEQVQTVHREMGLDRPAPVRYLEWIQGVVTGDLGTSTQFGGPVGPLVWHRFENSAILGGIAWLAIMPLALILGVIAGLRPGHVVDRCISIACLVTASVPSFAVAVFLILFFSIRLNWLPAVSTPDSEQFILQSPEKLVLPLLVLILAEAGYVARITRSSVASIMDSPYVRTATLKGLPYLQVVRKHVLRNALLAPITVMLLYVNSLVGGLVIVETIFGYPGLGALAVGAATTKDLDVIQATTMLFVVLAVVTQLFADVLYTWATPRVRFT